MERISRRLFTALTGGIGIQQALTGRVLGARGSSSDTRSQEHSGDDSSTGLSVSVTTPDAVFESSTVVATLVVHNPNADPVTDTVTVTGLRGDVFDREVTLRPSEEIRQPVRITVPDGAAGHTGEVTATSSTDTATATLSFAPQMTPSVTSASLQETGLTATYTVSNAGSAPGITDVTVTVNGDVVETRSESLGIDDVKTFTVSVSDVTSTDNTVTVLTGSGSDSATTL